jgi:Flp pilus assembly protein protease CpaA
MFEALSFSSLGYLLDNENLFLIFIALIWISIAVIQDFRKREVANWWNFSLIIFVLVFRAFVSVSNLEYWYFLWGLIGLFFGFIFANLFYYARLFAGGDAKLLMALGSVLPISFHWQENLLIFLIFLALFLITGGIYGLIYGFFLGIFNHNKFGIKFLKQFKKYSKIIALVSLLALVFFGLSLFYKQYLISSLSLIFFLCPFLFISAISIEKSCMNKLVKIQDLTIGDWLAEKIYIGNKIIKPSWEGLSEKELKLIQKNIKKRVLVRYGIPFTPAFLFGYILTIMFLYRNFLL